MASYDKDVSNYLADHPQLLVGRETWEAAEKEMQENDPEGYGYTFSAISRPVENMVVYQMVDSRTDTALAAAALISDDKAEKDYAEQKRFADTLDKKCICPVGNCDAKRLRCLVCRFANDGESMLWQFLVPAAVAAASPPRPCRPSLTVHGQSAASNDKHSLLFKPSCGSLDTKEDTFAIFQSARSASGAGSDVDPLAEWVAGNITEDAIAVDVHPDSETVTVVAASADGQPIFHTLSLSLGAQRQQAQAQLGAQPLARADCDKCHAAMCQPSCQPPLPQSCAFYTSCAEDSLHCGPEGYPLRYGDKICNEFLDRLSHFSAPTGQNWVLKVLTCLQEALVQPLNEQCDMSCQQLFDTAFKSHPACYADSGVCFLPVQDLVQIVITVGSDLVFGPALEQALSLGGRCVGQYIQKVEEVIEEAKKAGDVAKRILYEGVKKFLEAIA